MKKILVLLMILALVFSSVACGGAGSTGGGGKQEGIKIGVSIWSSTDTLGSQVKTMLDAAADALGVELTYVDQAHISERVTASMETLAAAGVDGVIICNSSSAEMTSVINTANENKVYVAQFFRSINEQDNPDEYALAKSSPYYVGTVHEDEVDNGHKLAYILGEKATAKLLSWVGSPAMPHSWPDGKDTREAWKHGTRIILMILWNYLNPSTAEPPPIPEGLPLKQFSLQPRCRCSYSIRRRGDPLIGAIQAIEGLGKTGQIGVASTDFLHDLDVQLEKRP